MSKRVALILAVMIVALMPLACGNGEGDNNATADDGTGQEWIVVTGWMPHWKFGAFDLKFLEDPRGSYGGEETINTIVRQGLQEEMPGLCQFLDNYHLDMEQLHQMMAWNQEGAEPLASGQRWMGENAEQVESWLPESMPENTDATVTLGYVEWACATASTHLVKAVIEDKFGYTVELQSVGAGPMWSGVANGDFDAIVAAWLPHTHSDYMEEYGDQIVNLGPNIEGAKIGLVVPTYVTIDSIEELDANADKFGGVITGIDAGAGIMRSTEQAIEDYGMENMELQASSGAAMTAELKRAIEGN